jgi:hypothetical protein
MALQLLDAIVAEFNLPSATPLGLAWDYHERCAREMEVGSMQTLTCTALLPTSLTRSLLSSSTQPRLPSMCRKYTCVPSLPQLPTWHAKPQHLAAP